MKNFRDKGIILTALLLISFSGSSQISITSANMPSANDTIRYSIVQNANGVDFKTTGENKSWDFTSLSMNSQDIYAYKNSTSTPYVLNFGFSALGLKIADSLGSGQMSFKNVYSFFKKTSVKWEAVGIGFQLSALPLPQAGKHTNTDEIYQFPLNYKDKDSASFALKIPLTAIVLPIGNYFQDGNRVNTVDGWGKISTPYKSNVDCIRIKSVITETDSLAVEITGQAPINFAFPNNRIEYKWLSTSEKIPMLEVTGTEVGGNFTPTQIRYRDNYKVNTSPQAPVANFNSNKVNAIINEVVTFTNLSTNSPTAYLWTITPNTYNFTNGTSDTSKNPQVIFLSSGTYTIKLKATNTIGANTVTKSNYINIVTAIQNLPLTNLVAYPNPANDKITIEIPSLMNQSLKLFVFDLSGKKVSDLDYISENNAVKLNTASLSTGRYTVIIYLDKVIYYTSVNIL